MNYGYPFLSAIIRHFKHIVAAFCHATLASGTLIIVYLYCFRSIAFPMLPFARHQNVNDKNKSEYNVYNFHLSKKL